MYTVGLRVFNTSNFEKLQDTNYGLMRVLTDMGRLKTQKIKVMKSKSIKNYENTKTLF